MCRTCATKQNQLLGAPEFKKAAHISRWLDHHIRRRQWRTDDCPALCAGRQTPISRGSNLVPIGTAIPSLGRSFKTRQR